MNLGSDFCVSPLGQSPHTIFAPHPAFLLPLALLSRGSANACPSDRILLRPVDRRRGCWLGEKTRCEPCSHPTTIFLSFPRPVVGRFHPVSQSAGKFHAGYLLVYARSSSPVGCVCGIRHGWWRGPQNVIGGCCQACSQKDLMEGTARLYYTLMSHLSLESNPLVRAHHHCNPSTIQDVDVDASQRERHSRCCGRWRPVYRSGPAMAYRCHCGGRMCCRSFAPDSPEERSLGGYPHGRNRVWRIRSQAKAVYEWRGQEPLPQRI